MKIRVSLHEDTAHIHLHRSKSKSTLKNILNQHKSTHKRDSQAYSLQYENDPLSQNITSLIKESQAKVKKSCEHKKKVQVVENGDYGYFGCSHRSRE